MTFTILTGGTFPQRCASGGGSVMSSVSEDSGLTLAVVRSMTRELAASRQRKFIRARAASGFLSPRGLHARQCWRTRRGIH
jgi:hypothetical protein